MNAQRIAISLVSILAYRIRYNNNKEWGINHTYLCVDLSVCRTLTSRLRSETQTRIRLKYVADKQYCKKCVAGDNLMDRQYLHL